MKSICYYVVLSLLLLSGMSSPKLWASPEGEIVYFASENGPGTQSILYLLNRRDTFSTPVALGAVPGRSSSLVVCEGAAYWAVDGVSGGTTLYRSLFAQGTIETVGTFGDSTSRQLKTDGHLVYWATDAADHSTLSYIHNRVNTVTTVRSVSSGASKALKVNNGNAYWGYEVGDTAHPVSFVMQFMGRAEAGYQKVLQNSKINGLELEEGYLWLLTTLQTDTPSCELDRGRAADTFGMTVVATSPGVGQQLALKRNRAYWTVYDAAGQTFKLFKMAYDNSTLVTVGSLGGSPASLCLMEEEGILAANKGSDCSIFRFDLIDGATPILVQSFLGTQAVDASSSGDVAFLTVQETGNPAQKVYRIKQGKPMDLTSAKMIGRIEIGRWEAFWFSPYGLVIQSREGSGSSSYYYSVPVGEKAQVAIGKSVPAQYYFAASAGPDQRGLYGYNGNQIVTVPPSLGNAYFPSRVLNVGGRLYFSALVDGQNRLCETVNGGAPARSDSHYYNPESLSVFKGQLFYRTTNELTGQLSLVQRVSGPQDFIIEDHAAGLSSGLVGESTGFAYYYKKNDTNQWALFRIDGNPGPAAKLVQTFGSADLPPPDGFTVFRRNLFYFGSNAQGKRSLYFTDDQGNSSSVFSGTDSLSGLTRHEGYLYFLSSAAGGSSLYRVNRDMTVQAISTFAFKQAGELRSLGNYLYFKTKNAEGSSLYRITTTGAVSLVQSFYGDIQSLRIFDDNLLITATDQSGTRLYRMTNLMSQASILSSQIFDPADFTPFSSGILFSAADAGGKRSLYAYRNGSVGTISGASFSNDSFGFNPRGLAVFQDQLLFSAYDNVKGRELWAMNYQNSSSGSMVNLSDIAPGTHGANPDIDGPSNFQLSSLKISENLPVGSDVGGVAALDRENLGPVVLSVLNSPSPTGEFAFRIAGSRLQTNQPFSYLNTGGQLALVLEGRNKLGIFNDVAFNLEVLKNYYEWVQTNFPDAGGPVGVADPLADPDQDGVSNLEERALGQDPNLANGGQGKPSVNVVAAANNTSYSVLQFRVPVAGFSDIKYSVEVSNDLVQWSSIATLSIDSTGKRVFEGPSASMGRVTLDQPAGQNFFNVTIGDTQNFGIDQKRFLRLKISD